MTITITKFKLAVSVLAIAMLGATSAFAHDTFTDVPDGTFYHDPVMWLADNGLTTGSPSGSDTFKPLDNVTRGEYATFNYRYDQNVIQPALENLQNQIDALQAAVEPLGTLHWAMIRSDGTIVSASEGVNTSAAETRRLSEGIYEVDFDVLHVEQCHAMISLSFTGAGAAYVDGEILAEQRLGDPSSIFIATGTSDGTDQDMPFTIQLWCSPAAAEFVLLGRAATSDALGGQAQP